MAEQNNTIRIAYRLAGSNDPWQVLRLTGDEIQLASSAIETEEARTDRMIDDYSTVSIDPSGSINFRFTADTFDDLLTAAMHSAFDNGSIKIGTDQVKFDILKSHTTINKHTLYKNMSVSEANIEIAEGSYISGSFSFVGEDVETGYDASGDTFLDTTTTGVINCNKDLEDAALLFDGVSASASGLYIKSLSININNNYEAARAIAHMGPVDQSPGTADVSGSVTLQVGAAAYDLWSTQIDDTDHSLAFTFGSGKTGESDYTVKLPRVRLTEGSLPGVSASGLGEMSFSLKALRDPASNTSLEIIKVDDVI